VSGAVPRIFGRSCRPRASESSDMRWSRSPAASRCGSQTAGHLGTSILMMSLGRRLRPEILISDQALQQAKAFARAEREREA